MTEYITNVRFPWILGVHCPRCQTLVWLDTHTLEVYRAYKAGRDLGGYAYDDCPNCTEQRMAREASVAEQDRRINLVYPLWSPVIGPHIDLMGMMYEGEIG